jgi:hypothetical protein
MGPDCGQGEATATVPPAKATKTVRRATDRMVRISRDRGRAVEMGLVVRTVREP